MSGPRASDERGFSLIEVLCALVVIGIGQTPRGAEREFGGFRRGESIDPNYPENQSLIFWLTVSAWVSMNQCPAPGIPSAYPPLSSTISSHAAE